MGLSSPKVKTEGFFKKPPVIIYVVKQKILKQDQRSQMLTPRKPKGIKIRGFKVKTSTQKLKSQYVISAEQGKN